MATNLLTYSEDFSQSYWRGALTTLPVLTPGQADPFGGYRAYILEDVHTGGVSAANIETFSVQSGASYTLSVFVKKPLVAGVTAGLLFGSSNNWRGIVMRPSNSDFAEMNFCSGSTGVVEDFDAEFWRVSVSGIAALSTVKVYVYCAFNYDVSMSNVGLSATVGANTLFGAQFVAGTSALPYEQKPIESYVAGPVTADSGFITADSNNVDASGDAYVFELTVGATTAGTTAESVLLSQQHEIIPAGAALQVDIDGTAIQMDHQLLPAGLALQVDADTLGVQQDQTLVSANATAFVTLDALALQQEHDAVLVGLALQTNIDNVSIDVEHLLTPVNANAQAVLASLELGQSHQLAGADATAATAIDGLLLSQEHELGVGGLTSASEVNAIGVTQQHVLLAGDLVAVTLAESVLVDTKVSMQPATLRVVTRTDDTTRITQHAMLTIDETKACTQISVPAPLPDYGSSVIGSGATGSLASSGGATLLSGSSTSLLGGGGTTLLGQGSGSSLSSGTICPIPEPVECPDPEVEVAQAKRVDFISDLLLYRGEADPGVTDDQPLWRIRRITIGTDDDVTEEWANGSADYVHVWDNRLGYTYS